MSEEQLITDTVVIEGTKPPFGTSKTGVVRGNNGKEYRATPGVMGMLKIGGAYQISYVPNEFNNKTYLMVKSVKAVDNGAVSQSGAQTTPRYANNAQNSGNDTQKSIFVCGGLNQGIASQQVNVMDPQSIVAAARALMTAYDNTLGAKPGAQTGMAPKPAETARDDMDDEIPF